MVRTPPLSTSGPCYHSVLGKALSLVWLPGCIFPALQPGGEKAPPSASSSRMGWERRPLVTPGRGPALTLTQRVSLALGDGESRLGSAQLPRPKILFSSQKTDWMLVKGATDVNVLPGHKVQRGRKDLITHVWFTEYSQRKCAKEVSAYSALGTIMTTTSAPYR